EGGEWAMRHRLVIPGNRIGLPLAVAWLVGVAVALACFLGWHHWVARQHMRAGKLVHRAETVSARGDSKDLEDALRRLQRALEVSPRSKEAALRVPLVRLEQVLEEGAFDVGLLRSPVARAERAGVDEAYVHTAMAVLLTSEGRTSQARKELAKALR